MWSVSGDYGKDTRELGAVNDLREKFNDVVRAGALTPEELMHMTQEFDARRSTQSIKPDEQAW